jgi:hypothetical protein
VIDKSVLLLEPSLLTVPSARSNVKGASEWYLIGLIPIEWDEKRTHPRAYESRNDAVNAEFLHRRAKAEDVRIFGCTRCTCLRL